MVSSYIQPITFRRNLRSSFGEVLSNLTDFSILHPLYTGHAGNEHARFV